MTKKFNPWHDVVPTTKDSDTVIGVIEIPRGSRAKYEVDKETGMLRLDRVLYSSVYYPTNYGFIPQTYCGDHDPLDILVISQVDIMPLCLVPSRVIGVMRMVDNEETDDKIIAVADGDVNFSHINDINDLPRHTLEEIENFFQTYKQLEKKKVVVKKFLSKKEAMLILKLSLDSYQELINKKNPHACFGNAKPHIMDFDSTDEFRIRLSLWEEWQVEHKLPIN